MEQLTNPKDLFDPTIGEARPVPPPPKTYPLKTDPARAWLRLNEAVIPTTAPAAAPISEAVTRSHDLLRSRLLRQLRRDGLRKLALTSPTSGCGTTQIAATLALGLARQIDLKVMVFDFNLRRPMLANQFALGPIAPLSSALAGSRRDFDSRCLRVNHNLAVSLAISSEPNPAELLATSRARALVAQLEREFEPDVMIFDLPPVLPHDDVVAASDLFDAALLIARADHSTISQIDEAERLISEQKPCLGVVMNACRFPSQRDKQYAR